MQRYDAVVIGGGPAGSATAYHLASSGFSVLLADRATFPRDKPCGGGLTTRAFLQCPVDPSPVVEDEVDLVELRFRYGGRVVRSAKEPVIRMTQRRRLDAFLLEAAGAAGAEVRQGAEVDHGERLRIDGAPIDADVIVGADGANGKTARAHGLGEAIVRGVALEGNLPYGQLARDRYEHRAVIELADIPGGYGWVFPKADHVNVGVGAWASHGSQLRDYLARVCRGHGVALSDLQELRGHRLPLRTARTRIATERALLVGDAAGLIDPVSGDGMYECFVSARLAAGSVADLLSGRASTLDGYERAADDALGPLHRASWMLKSALDRWPRASWRIARTRLLWSSVERLLLAQSSAPQDERGLARLPLRGLEALGKLGDSGASA
jgi:geranylgeranyl reductase family protein